MAAIHLPACAHPEAVARGIKHHKFQHDTYDRSYQVEAAAEGEWEKLQSQAHLETLAAMGRRVVLRFTPMVWQRTRREWRYVPLPGWGIRVSCATPEDALEALRLDRRILLALNGMTLVAADASTPDAPTQPLPALERDASFDSADH